MTKYTMLKTIQGSRDGLKVETFHKGQTYDLNPELAEQFYHEAAVEEVGQLVPRELGEGETLEEGELPAGSTATRGAASIPADSRQKKVTGPTETKEGEAGVDLDTQNIEELVALARDTYGLEVDTTMSVEDVKALIEQAQGEASEADDTTKGAAKKAKKQKH